MCNTKFQHCKHVRRDCSYYLRVRLLDTSCQTVVLSIHRAWSSVRNRRLWTEPHCPTKQTGNRGIIDRYFSHFFWKFSRGFQKFAVSGNQKFVWIFCDAKTLRSIFTIFRKSCRVFWPMSSDRPYYVTLLIEGIINYVFFSKSYIMKKNKFS